SNLPLTTAMNTKSRSVAAPSETAAPSPFPAALTSTPQLAENAPTLSPAFATLTDRVKAKSCICHSYKKQPGVGAGLGIQWDSHSWLSLGVAWSLGHESRNTGHGPRSSYSSKPAARSFASNVFGDTPSFSEARVLFHLHSRKVLSSSTRSTCPTARPATSSSVPSQLNCSGSIPVGNAPVSGFVAGNCKPSAVMLSPSVR